MAIIDKFFRKTFGEQESEVPLNILICFSKTETGKSLCKIANCFLQSKIKNEQLSSLHLLETKEYESIKNIETFKAALYNEVMSECNDDNAIIRSFVKPSDDFVEEILSTSSELGCNLILIGIGKTVFNSQTWGAYQRFRSRGNAYKDIEESSNKISYRGVSSLLERNNNTTGIFIDQHLDNIDRIFVPILDKSDIHIFSYIKRAADKTTAEITLWDAIGAIESGPYLNKVFQNIQKNKEHVNLWDNNKKIDYDFIKQQDLIIIGIDGWEKLINSAITWSHSLPSTLIIREKTS